MLWQWVEASDSVPGKCFVTSKSENQERKRKADSWEAAEGQRTFRRYLPSLVRGPCSQENRFYRYNRVPASLLFPAIPVFGHSVLLSESSASETQSLTPAVDKMSKVNRVKWPMGKVAHKEALAHKEVNTILLTIAMCENEILCLRFLSTQVENLDFWFKCLLCRADEAYLQSSPWMAAPYPSFQGRN